MVTVLTGVLLFVNYIFRVVELCLLCCLQNISINQRCVDRSPAMSQEHTFNLILVME